VKGKFIAILGKFGTSTAWCETVMTYRQVFLLRSKMNGNCFYSFLSFVGPEGREGNYSYRIRIETKDSTESVSACHGTLSYLKNTDEILKSGNCFTVGTEFVNKCVDVNDELELQIEIYFNAD
jgi:hypothetical protein